MGAIKTMWIEAQDAIAAFEGAGENKTIKYWNEWVAKYADKNGQTPMGYVDDVYDVFTDFGIMAKNAGLDLTATQMLLEIATSALAEGKDPYDIQAQIDAQTAVYVDEEGRTVIGKIVLSGTY